ncbi:MAG: hypothetical protein QXU81_00065 [Candidatus Bathyarchaeia archaeon]
MWPSFIEVLTSSLTLIALILFMLLVTAILVFLIEQAKRSTLARHPYQTWRFLKCIEPVGSA